MKDLLADIIQDPRVHHINAKVTLSVKKYLHDPFMYSDEPLSMIHMVLDDDSSYPPEPNLCELLSGIPGIWDDHWIEVEPAENEGWCYRKDVDRIITILSDVGIIAGSENVESSKH